MKSIHLVITDLFLPNELSAEACAGLRLPALEKMLARGASISSARTDVSRGLLEDHLCELFGIPCRPGAPIAPISAAYDGLGEGCWLRADPVHLRLQRDQMVLLPIADISAGEAGQLCAALNEHFAGQGMTFFAPHPRRWYVRLDQLPDIETVPLSQAAGRNVRGLLPGGTEAARWHQVFNETQMLLFAHAVNDARETRGELPVNSLWFWGGGCDTLLMKPLAIRLGEQNTLAKSLVMAKPADCGSSREVALCAREGCDTPNQGDCGCSAYATLQKKYDSVSSDDELAGMFATAAEIPFAGWPERWGDSLSRGEREFSSDGRQLLVWTGLRCALQQGDLNAWRAALQGFETGFAQPLWQGLRSGKISHLQIDIVGGDRVLRLLLNRADAWAFWRRSKPLAGCSLV